MHVREMVDALLSQKDHEFTSREMFADKMLINGRSLVDDKCRSALKDRACLAVAKGEPGDEPAQEDENASQNEPTRQGVIPTIHRILNSVADEQNRDKFRGAHLRHLALPRDSQQDKYIQKNAAPSDHQLLRRQAQMKQTVDHGVNSTESYRITQGRPSLWLEWLRFVTRLLQRCCLARHGGLAQWHVSCCSVGPKGDVGE